MAELRTTRNKKRRGATINSNKTRLHRLDAKRLGQRLKALREAHELSQPKLASLMGITRGSIVNLEHPNRLVGGTRVIAVQGPSLATMISLSNAYNISIVSLVEYLVSDEDLSPPVGEGPGSES